MKGWDRPFFPPRAHGHCPHEIQKPHRKFGQILQINLFLGVPVSLLNSWKQLICVQFCNFEIIYLRIYPIDNLLFQPLFFFNIVNCNFCQVLAKNSVSDIEKREKKVLEKKLGEMEDELKVSGGIWNSILKIHLGQFDLCCLDNRDSDEFEQFKWFS